MVRIAWKSSHECAQIYENQNDEETSEKFNGIVTSGVCECENGVKLRFL